MEPTDCNAELTERVPPAQSIRFPFDSSSMTVIEGATGPLFVASEIGVALGYEDGRYLRDLIQGEWSDRLRPDKDVVKLTGADLAPLKSVGAVAANTTALVLLTESGLYRVLMLSGKPTALRMQEWLADEVLPTLRATGRYGATPRLMSDKLGEKSDAASALGDWRSALSFTRLQIAERKYEEKQRRRDERKRQREEKTALEWKRLEVETRSPQVLLTGPFRPKVRRR